jgi:hypothetical protein
MPDAISSTTPSVCDASVASCADFSPPAVAAAGAVAPTIVNLEPVVITGDAGAQELLRRYDTNQSCGAEKHTAALACPAIALGVLNTLEGGRITGLASAFHASFICGEDLRAFSDCRDAAQALEASAHRVVSDCHERSGNVSAGASANEIICEVTP